MALRPCTECNTPISDKAHACPQCGVPTEALRASARYNLTKRFHNPVVVLICLLTLGIIGGATLASKSKDDASVMRKAMKFFSDAAPARKKLHNYAVVENYEYGYEVALTDEDRKQGTLAKPLVKVRNLGTKGIKGGFQTVQVKSGPFISIYNCAEPCEFANGKTYLSNLLVKEESIRVAPGTILELALDDIRKGQLVDSESDVK